MIGKGREMRRPVAARFPNGTRIKARN